MSISPAMDGSEARRPRQDRAMLLTLIGCTIAAQADRHVMSLLAKPVQDALHLSDLQLGLLQGVAFSLFYAIAGLPLGWLLDRRARRVGIAGLCVLIWSLATIACGFVGSFVTLFFFRSLTAVAEAGLGPAAASLISQMGGRRDVMRASSFFMLAPWLGSGLALIGGGIALKLLTGSIEDPWRYIFVLLGLPGLALAPLLAWGVTERPRPERQQVADAVVKSGSSIPPFLPWHYAAMTANFLAMFGFVAWFPMLLVREHGMEVGSAGAASGAAFLTAGVIGTLVANRAAARRQDDSLFALIRFLKLIAAGAAVATAALGLSGSPVTALICYAGFVFLASMINSMMLVPLQLSVQPWQQARAAALMGLCTAAVGGSLGPLFVGVFSNGGMRLGLAIALTGMAGTLIAAACFFIAQTRLAGSAGDAALPQDGSAAHPV
ncbi:MAG: MFS transporter [Sphingomonas sp.]|uniref:MFS transporter n=1 Tax=Sphingomonas sp. TaxID=28214 RepID=UPI0025F3D94A|nr:MFS transporter [Sphingomonas sp.]MBX3563558.1 MFS transporter [Sphingomonas sp.]